MARDKWIDGKLKTAELQNILSFRINNIKLLYVSAESFYSSLWMGISLFNPKKCFFIAERGFLYNEKYLKETLDPFFMSFDVFL